MESPLLRRLVPGVVAFAACCSVTCCLPGCGGGGPTQKGVKPMVAASGKVTFDGQPVPAGTVSFLNQATGNMAICMIDDGTYECDSDAGPNPGRNTVLIVGKESEEGNPMWGGSWTKEVDVGETDFTEDFAITKDQVKPFDPASVQIDN